MPNRPGAGRPAGSPNKNSLKFAKRLDEIGLDLIAEINKLLPDLEPYQRVQTMLTMMRYTYPALKSIEMQVDSESALMLSRANVAQLCEIARKASIDAATNHDSA